MVERVAPTFPTPSQSASPLRIAGRYDGGRPPHKDQQEREPHDTVELHEGDEKDEPANELVSEQASNTPHIDLAT